MLVDVQLATDSSTPEPALIQRWAESALAGGSEGSASRHGVAGRVNGGESGAPDAASALAHAELCVRIVDEDESQHLNREYRHQDAPTNVLSFPASVELPGALILGDVVVCAPVVQREADAQRKPYQEHFAHMVVHGVLHLLGYDHQSAAEAADMEQLETRILAGFGVPDPYGEG